MQGSRPSIFDNDVDLTPFKPKIDQEPANPPETVRRVAAESGFPSRSPHVAAVAFLNPPTDQDGPDGSPQCPRHATRHDRFHAIVAAEQARYEAGEIMHRPTLGEIVERALLALEREMKGEGSMIAKRTAEPRLDFSFRT